MPVTAKPASYTAGAATLRPNHLWMFDEGSGTTLTDQGSTGGKNLTIVGADWTTDATHGPILDFIAANLDYAHLTETGSEPVMGISTGFTVALILRVLDTPAAIEPLMAVSDVSALNVYYGMSIDATGDITPAVRNTTALVDDNVTAADLDDDVWHLAVLTIGDSTQSSSVDGAGYEAKTLAANINDAAIDTFAIGGRRTTSSSYADVKVAAAAVWVNALLSEAQQLSLWNSGDVWTAMGISEGLPASAPTITDVDTDEDVTHGEALTVTGTDFGAAQATHTSVVEILSGTLAVVQTCSGWSDTEFTIAAADTTGLPFGAITGLRITNVNGTDELPLTHSVPSGYAYGVVSVPWPDGTYSVFDGASPAMADGDQYEYEVLTDQGVGVEVFPDGTMVIDSDTGTHQFDIRVFDQTDETWSAWVTETVSAAATGGELVVVPNVIAMSQSSATIALNLAGGLIPSFSTASSPSVAYGDVISTDPAAGSQVDYGSIVELVISIGTQAPGTGGAGYPVDWQRPRKKLTIRQQPNKHLKKLLDDAGKKVLATHGMPKKAKKVKPIKLWS